MTSKSADHGSARIYQFPPGGRAALDARRNSESPLATDGVEVRIADSRCWYHEEAIEEANRNLEH